VWTFTLPNSRHPQFNSRTVPHSQHISVRITLHILDFILRVLITATVIAAGATLQLTTLGIHPSQEPSLYHSILSITSIACNYDYIYRRKSTVARSQDSSICSSACLPVIGANSQLQRAPGLLESRLEVRSRYQLPPHHQEHVLPPLYTPQSTSYRDWQLAGQLSIQLGANHCRLKFTLNASPRTPPCLFHYLHPFTLSLISHHSLQ
jgi:hypothetical protein